MRDDIAGSIGNTVPVRTSRFGASVGIRMAIVAILAATGGVFGGWAAADYFGFPYPWMVNGTIGAVFVLLAAGMIGGGWK